MYLGHNKLSFVNWNDQIRPRTSRVRVPRAAISAFPAAPSSSLALQCQNALQRRRHSSLALSTLRAVSESRLPAALHSALFPSCPSTAPLPADSDGVGIGTGAAGGAGMCAPRLERRRRLKLLLPPKIWNALIDDTQHKGRAFLIDDTQHKSRRRRRNVRPGPLRPPCTPADPDPVPATAASPPAPRPAPEPTPSRRNRLGRHFKFRSPPPPPPLTVRSRPRGPMWPAGPFVRGRGGRRRRGGRRGLEGGTRAGPWTWPEPGRNASTGPPASPVEKRATARHT